MSLLEAIREATGKGCDVLFYDSLSWGATTIQLKYRLPSKGGDVVATAYASVSYKEFSEAYCPEALFENRLREATEKVLDDSRLD